MFRKKNSTEPFYVVMLDEGDGTERTGLIDSSTVIQVKKATGVVDTLSYLTDYTWNEVDALKMPGLYEIVPSNTKFTSVVGDTVFYVRYPGTRIEKRGYNVVLYNTEDVVENDNTNTDTILDAIANLDFSAILTAITDAKQEILDALGVSETNILNILSANMYCFEVDGSAANPFVIEIYAPRRTQVRITFSRAMNTANTGLGTTNPANYVIPGLTVLGAQLLPSGEPDKVLLITTPQTPGATYNITITVEDVDNNPL